MHPFFQLFFMVTQTVLSINRKYCKSDTCRFIVPIAIAEQESKAQLHFRQIAYLAGKVNRTIVLPNVSRSHLGACRKYPFDYYYDTTWLDKNRAKFNYITQSDFLEWTSARSRLESKPSGQEITLEMNKQHRFPERTKNCLASMFDFKHKMIRFELPDPVSRKRRHGINYSKILTNALSDKQTSPEVLHLYYDRRVGFIKDPAANKPLDFNQRWTEKAEAIAQQLGYYVAIHWRIERLEPLSHMMPCAEALYSKVKKIQALNPQVQVFLLTDYPHLLNTSGATPESQSFPLSQLKQEHHDAFRYLYERLDITVTTLAVPPHHELPDHWHVLQVSTNDTDPAILGIVDKLVGMRAQWFLAGMPGECAKASSFTNRIISDRLLAYKKGARLEQVVDTFSVMRK
ncbi:hypothetical protein K501DRAFT_324861 [Backusella circina FSU 941]|nr:hypothetical protein K501DRAFT_324861 [Backusella circina FSU 941]